ncbi:uncharacterized protein LOC132917918 [Rhopalosiphum padi]|uniref:uncharacterized protein LOC132917918 n=1 Tax=Rhopalosiphum padi TaxID=40932 RepID=UPI00298DEB1D|nr:uncharacterized protein LOC132917918 [Rhopalosiphum padi]
MELNIFFIFIQVIFTIISSASSANFKLFSSSPIGPYRMVFKQVYICNPAHHYKIQMNWHLSHEDNKTVLLGNTTLEVPFDDNLSLEMKMAFKDSSGSWRENAFMHKALNACTSTKLLLGSVWTTFVNGFGSQNTNCPILPDAYISSGVNPSIFEKSNFPKELIYGTYKMHIIFNSRKNDIFGCVVFIIEIKR